MTRDSDSSRSSGERYKRRRSRSRSREARKRKPRQEVERDRRGIDRRRSPSPKPHRNDKPQRERRSRRSSRSRSRTRSRSRRRSSSRSRSHRARSPGRTRDRSPGHSQRHSSRDRHRDRDKREAGERKVDSAHPSRRTEVERAPKSAGTDAAVKTGSTTGAQRDEPTLATDGQGVSGPSPSKQPNSSAADGTNASIRIQKVNGSGPTMKLAGRLSFEDELEGNQGEQLERRPSLRQLTESRMELEHKLSKLVPPSRAIDNQPHFATLSMSSSIRDDGRPAMDSSPLASPSSPKAPVALGRIHVGVAQARGARPYMEDRHSVVADLLPRATAVDGAPRSLFAVYDGHNGVRAADTAAARMHQLLAAEPCLKTYTGAAAPASVARAEEAAVKLALQRAFREVDDEVLAGSRSEGGRDGATALVLLRLGAAMYAAHAGDSRAVLCRGGSASRLTEDHKPNLPAERSRVEGAGGRVEFQRCWRVIVEPRPGRPGSGLAVSRSLGDLDFKEPHRFVECEPDVGRTQLQPDDRFIILGSDGLWDVMSDADAVATAKKALEAAALRMPRVVCDEGASAAAEALLAEAVARGTADNITVLMLLLQWD